MNEIALNLRNPPIVEAVLDIDCDPPRDHDFESLQDRVRGAFREGYPKFREQFLLQHRVNWVAGGQSEFAERQALQAYQLLHEDELQLVQVRTQGYSFNRLKPYTSLDDYLPEIKRTWEIYRGLANPVEVAAVRLRYVNRILLPLSPKLELNEYLRIGPRLPDESTMTLRGFLYQYVAQDRETGHEVQTVLTLQSPRGDKLPVILDNCVTAQGPVAPDDWAWIEEQIGVLRELKNRVFTQSITPACLELFR